MRELLARDPKLWLSRSWTTRTRRSGEASDVYTFVDRAEFERRVADGGFLEWAPFLDNFYGTPWPPPSGPSGPPEGADVVLEIDVKGAAQVVAGDADTLMIFLLPPSAEEQERRLLARGDDLAHTKERLAVAADELAMGRTLGAIEIVNDDLERTIEVVAACIEDARRSR